MSIKKVNDVYRVCIAGICKEHKQEWQAKVFYHQMQATAQPPAPDPKANKADP